MARHAAHIAKIHFDSGSEFVTHCLAEGASTRHVTCMRERPSRKSDQADIEHKVCSSAHQAPALPLDTLYELDPLSEP